MVISMEIEGFRGNDVPFFAEVAMVSLDGAGNGAGGSVRESESPRFGKAQKASGGTAPRSRPTVPALADPAQSLVRERSTAAGSDTPGDRPAPEVSTVSATNASPARETGSCGEGPGTGGHGQGEGGPAADGHGGGPGPGGAGPASSGAPGYGFGGDVPFGSAMGPAFLEKEMPVYPALARRLGREGLVVLRLDIDERGVLTRLEVLEDPGFGFSAAAAEAARKSRFSPARVNGRPAACRALLPVRFELRHGR